MLSKLEERGQIPLPLPSCSIHILSGLDEPTHVGEDHLLYSTDKNANLFLETFSLMQPEIVFYPLSGHSIAQSRKANHPKGFPKEVSLQNSLHVVGTTHK